MRTMLILVAAVTLGLTGGYAWSAMTVPAARAAKPPKAGMMQFPASPGERPTELDSQWASRSGDQPRATTRASPPAAQDGSVRYSGCNEVRAAGKAPLYEGQPGYSEDMDGDADGVACEPMRSH